MEYKAVEGGAPVTAYATMAPSPIHTLSRFHWKTHLTFWVIKLAGWDTLATRAPWSIQGHEQISMSALLAVSYVRTEY